MIMIMIMIIIIIIIIMVHLPDPRGGTSLLNYITYNKKKKQNGVILANSKTTVKLTNQFILFYIEIYVTTSFTLQ